MPSAKQAPRRPTLLRRRLIAATSGGGGGGGGETVNFVLSRNDGNSGTVMVTGTVPLKPGAMVAGDLTKLRIYDNNGAEKAIGIQALRGAFPDGSLRAVAVQFLHSLNNLQELLFTVNIGGSARGTTDLTYTEIIFTSGTATIPAMNHRTTFIPDDPTYWCATFVLLVPLKPEANWVADSAATYFKTASGTASTLGQWAATLDATDYGAANGVSTWEHLHAYYCAAAQATNRAERLAHYRRANETLINQMGGDDYYRIGANITNSWNKAYGGVDSSLPAATNPNEPNVLTEAKSGQAIGWAAGYLMSGWKQPWRYVARQASWGYGVATATYAGYKDQAIGPYYGIRFNMQYKMQFLACAFAIHATMQVGDGYGGGWDNSATGSAFWGWMLDSCAEFILTTANSYARMNGLVGIRNTVRDDGGLGSTNTPDFPIFQGMAAVKFLSFFYDNIYPDSRIPVWIKAWADFVLTQVIDEGTYYSMPYFSTDTPASASRDPWFLSFHTKTFAWVYASTGNTTYKTWALRAANARELTNPSGYTPTVKAMGEYFSGDQQSAKYYIDGGGLRSFSGAHPSTYVTIPTYTS